tara:strand:+ start:78 stop:419 length:342 start_codon:yes stop_codon:yes gene_type:complete
MAMYVTVRYTFDTLGNLQLDVDKPNFGYHTQSPRSMKAEIVDFSPEFEDAKVNIARKDGVTWVNVKTAEPTIAAKRGKAQAKTPVKTPTTPATPTVDPALLAAIIAAMGSIKK